MTAQNFAQIMPRVLVHEGGKSNDPRDPGGRTNQGITQRTYSAWKRNNGGQAGVVYDVFNMTPDERDAIYRTQYWNAVQGDLLPAGVDYAVFDGAVNSGPLQAIKWLQRALGIEADGVLGHQTLDALSADPDNDKLVERISDRRLAFMQALTTWKTYGPGWTTRVLNVEQVSEAWATGTVGPMPSSAPGSSAKALLDDATPVIGATTAKVGTGIGTATAILPQAAQHLTSLSAIPGIDKVIIGVTVAGVVLGGAAWAYATYTAARKAKLDDVLDRKAA